MDGDATPSALARIDAALARIEAAAARPRASGGASGGGGDPDLQRKHLRLRAEVELALRELDGLISGSQTGDGQ